MIKNYLDDILQRKMHELYRQPSGLFAAALKQPSLAVIAEIKRKSPSRGQLADISQPVELAKQYCEGNASAISVLTDKEGFAGSLTDLQQVTMMLKNHFPHVPALRKDFIIHPYQLVEAAASGAACVLLITSILKNNLQDFISKANQLGLETLTEIHDEDDLQYALNANPPIIGVNHRNLKTFEFDMTASSRLIRLLPDDCIKVAESGIRSVETAKRMRELGYDAVLIGEALVTSQTPQQLIAEIRQLT